MKRPARRMAPDKKKGRKKEKKGGERGGKTATKKEIKSGNKKWFSKVSAQVRLIDKNHNIEDRGLLRICSVGR
jgi:hypothetical protein